MSNSGYEEYKEGYKQGWESKAGKLVLAPVAPAIEVPTVGISRYEQGFKVGADLASQYGY